MNEIVDEKTGEVIEVPEVALTKTSAVSMVKEVDRPMFDAMEKFDSLDWRRLPPNVMALLLTQKPFNASGGGTMYLNLRQAMLFALRCYELGLSPLSGEVFFNPTTGTTNVTLEGKRTLARNRNIDLGPPSFVEVSREWKNVPRMTISAEDAKKAGFIKDVGVTCTMRVGIASLNETASYTAYLSEWYVGRSAVWKEKPMWMLSVRAQDKCITMALGTGVSDMQGDD